MMTTQLNFVEVVTTNPANATPIRDFLEQAYQGYILKATISSEGYEEVAKPAQAVIKSLEGTFDENLKKIDLLNRKVLTVANLIQTINKTSVYTVVYSTLSLLSAMESYVGTFLGKDIRITPATVISSKALRNLSLLFAAAAFFSGAAITVYSRRVSKIEAECKAEIKALDIVRRQLNLLGAIQ
jgi:hypothetical protein